MVLRQWKRWLSGWASVFGPHFFEDEEEKAETTRTENYIAMLRGKVIPVLKRKKIPDSCTIQQDGAPPHCSHFSRKFGLAEGAFWRETDLKESRLQLASLLSWPKSGWFLFMGLSQRSCLFRCRPKNLRTTKKWHQKGGEGAKTGYGEKRNRHYDSEGSKPFMQEGGLVWKIVEILVLFEICIWKCNHLSTN